MKKINFILLLLLGSMQGVLAQINWRDYSHSYQDKTLEKPNSVGVITTIKSINDSFWEDQDQNILFSPFAKDTAFLRARPKDILIRTIFDTSKVHIFLHGVNKSNAGEYTFRFYEYKGQPGGAYVFIDKFSDQKLLQQSGLPQMAYLGAFLPAMGTTVLVDIKKKGSDKIIETVAITRKALKPIIEHVYTANELNTFLNRLSRPYEADYQKSPKDKYDLSRLNPKTGAALPLEIDHADNTLIFFLKGKVRKKEQVEYQLERKGKVITPWKINDFDNSFIWLNDLKPGSYTLSVRYPIQRENISIINFELLPAWYQSNLFIILISILVAGSGGAFIFLMLFIRQKQITQQEQLSKTKVQLELKSIYAQLNPHFIFNAISSIQGLINMQDINGANTYLADLAKLMRESLVKSNKDLISIQEDQEMLKTYLKLEQLRFGFKYKIWIDDNIDIYNTEIPTLLLQPLIENAVKHGVSHRYEHGIISLNFTKVSDDMVIVINDNGSGIKEEIQPVSGYGLKLTKDRIELLNKLSNDQHIYMQINSQTTGTSIELKFSNWFL